MDVTIREPAAAEEERWRTLFAAYQRFYRASIPPEIVANTWQHILEPGSDVNALLAEVDGEVVGITNYVYHSSTWSDRPNCYLEDLYVDPAARGSDAARKLIEGVEAAARGKDAFRVYWHTQEFNGAARSLYDTITPRSSFIVYRKNL